MGTVLREGWTVEDFLAWENRQDLRHEFDGFNILAMTGGTAAHDAIQVNLVAAPHARLRGTPCRAHGGGLKVRVMDGIRYPDAFVSCTPVHRDATVVHEPVVVFEVTSRSTAFIDRGAKKRDHAGTASVRRYVMLEQRAIMATVFERAGDDWIGHILGAGTVPDMPEIGISLPLDELYDGLDVVGAAAGDDAED